MCNFNTVPVRNTQNYPISLKSLIQRKNLLISLLDVILEFGIVFPLVMVIIIKIRIMRKLFFGIAVSLTSLTACAQENKIVKADNTEISVAQDKFSEIGTTELPIAVTKAIDTYYPSAVIQKAFVNNSEQFKLEIVMEKGKSGTVYTDKDGEWIER